eukprot:jgi/Ulvmu1/6541/UM003_0175.1
METTRFLFPEGTSGGSATRNVFEPNPDGIPVIAKERRGQTSVPSLSQGASRAGSLPEWPSVPGAGDGKLAQYKHYDVQLDWSEGDIDTSVWAGDVQAYTRMFYARYGAGPPGQTPWRLGRGLKARFHDAKGSPQSGADTDTFMTKAHVEIQDKLKHTSLDLWQQFSSNPIEKVDLEAIKKWAMAMRPRSIHDLKPMLMLCQSLLRDVADVYSLQLDDAKVELENDVQEQLQAVQADHQNQAQALQRRVDALSALVDDPGQQPTGASAELERKLQGLQQQLQDKEEDLQAVAEQVRKSGGVPRTRDGAVIVPENAPPSRAGVNLLRSVTRMKTMARSFAAGRTSAGPSGGRPTAGSLQAGLATAEHHLPGFLAAHGFSSPTGALPHTAAVASTPSGTSADGHEIHRLNDGTEVLVIGRNPDGTPVFVLKDNPGQVVMRVDSAGRPVLAALPGGQPVMGVDARGQPVFAAQPPPAAAAPTGRLTAGGEEVYLLADGTEVMVVGQRADGSPIYARADDPTMVVAGVDASGAPVCVAREVVGTNADGSPVYGELPASALSSAPSGARERAGSGLRWAAAGGDGPCAGLERRVQADGTEVFVIGYAADGTEITVPVDTPLEWSESGAPMLAGVEIGAAQPAAGSRRTAAATRSLSRKASRRAAAPLVAGAMPDVAEVVRADGSVGFTAGRAPDGTVIEVAAEAVVGRLADGTPVFAEGTVVGFTEDGVAIVADGFGGTREDRHAGGMRMDSAAVAAAMTAGAARVQAARAAGYLPSATAFVTPEDEGGELRGEAAGRQVAHELLKRMGSTADVDTAARMAVRAVAAGSAAGALDAAPVLAVGCVALGAAGEVLGYVDEGLVARNFHGHKLCDMVEVDLTAADGSDAFATTAAAAVCAGAVLATCTATPLTADGDRAAAQLEAFVGVDGSVFVDRGAPGTEAAEQLTVLGALEDDSVVDRAGAAVAAVSDVKAVRVADVPADILPKLAACEQQAAPGAVCLPVDYAYAEDRDGGVLGQILADGRVVDAAGGCAGFVQPDGSVRSAEGVRVGSARRGVAVCGTNGKLAAVVSEQGYAKAVAGGAAGAAAAGAFEGELSADGVLRGSDGKVIGVAVARAPVPDAVVRDSAGVVVGAEGASGVVRTLSGTAVGYVGADGDIVSFPATTDDDDDGAAAALCAGWKLDQSVRALLDGDGRVLGTVPVRSESGAANGGATRHGVAGGAAAVGLDVMEGVREKLGLLWEGDGKVVGSCVTWVAAGMAVVSMAGKVLGDVGQDGTVVGKTGSILGTVDERGLLRHGPGCTPLGAVAAVTAVRDLVGTLTAVLTPDGAVLGVDLQPVAECHVSEDGTIWSTPEGGGDAGSGRGAVLGFAQGQPPPLGLLSAADGRSGVVQWHDQRARLEGGGWVGWWQSSGAGGVVDEGGAEVEAGLMFALPQDGPAEDLPQAVDMHGVFLGHVLPSRAVIGRDGVQVGVIMPDGTVLSGAHECIGHMHFGEAATHQTVLAVNGVPLGILQPDGTVVSVTTGKRAGLLTPSGRVLDSAGRFVGTARTARLEGLIREADGTVRDEDGTAVGRVAADGNIVITQPMSSGGGGGPYGAAAMEIIVEHKTIQACLDGAIPLAQLLSGDASDASATAGSMLDREPSLPQEPVSRTASHLRLLRGAARLVGLNATARRHALQAQLTRLEELRQDVVHKMNSKAVKDSLRELRKYRRPPRAAAQVVTATMVVCGEPSCAEWQAQALAGLQFPSHQNHVAQIWVSIAPLLATDLGARLGAVDGADTSNETAARLQAGQQLLQGMTEKEAKRASISVRLLYEFLQLLQEAHTRARELESLDRRDH